MVPVGGNQRLVLTEGVGPASGPLPREVCVMPREQLRKHFSGDRQSKLALTQQLE